MKRQSVLVLAIKHYREQRRFISCQRKYVRMYLLCLLPLFGGLTQLTFGDIFSIEPPGAYYTNPSDISGGNVVGHYSDGTQYVGFLYDGTNYTTLTLPGATLLQARGISGSNIVGGYSDATGHHGFLYDGTNYTTLNYPGATNTWADGISGDNIVGEYNDGTGTHGFLYDGTNYTSLNFHATGTQARDIDGSNIVGWSQIDGFIFDGTNYTALNYPGSTRMYIHGISGSNIVGQYDDDTFGVRSFLYDGTSYTTLTLPGATHTIIAGIDGSNIVGEYYDGTNWHGFMGTLSDMQQTSPEVIPAPSAVILGSIGLSFSGWLLKRKRML